MGGQHGVRRGEPGYFVLQRVFEYSLCSLGKQKDVSFWTRGGPSEQLLSRQNAMLQKY